MIPHDPNGYAVNERTGEIHRRYADHAKGLRRTTAAGLYGVLGDNAPAPCETCWPPVKPKRPKPTRSWVEHHGDDEPTVIPATLPAFSQRDVDDAAGLATIADGIRITSTSIDLSDTNGGS